MITKDKKIYSTYRVVSLKNQKYQLLGNKCFEVNKTIANFIENLSTPLYYDEYLAKMAIIHHKPASELSPIIDGFLDKMLKSGIVEYEKEVASDNYLPFVEVNSVFDEKYLVLKSLVGKKKYQVFRAKNLTDNSDIVIKLFRLTKAEVLLQNKQEELKRFKDEFHKAIAFGEHPNLCKHFEFNEDNYVYFVIEYLSNIRLKDICISKKYPFKKQINWATDIIKAVAFVHNTGGLHGDLHAKNFMLDGKTGKLKMIDFDLALSPQLTDVALINGGIYEYLSPERVKLHKNKVFDSYSGSTTSEVYQLGVLLYFLFAHRLPFKAKTWEALATKIKYEAAKPVFKGKETTIKKMIAELIAECLEKDPQKRPSSAVEVWQQWEKIKYALN